MTTTISGTAGISPSGLQSIVGQVSHFAMLTPPPGWVECNGAAVSRTTYSKLFSAIGTLYGTGDGTTTFNLPELRGEFIRGADRGRGVDAGRMVGSYQADQFENHDHGFKASWTGDAGGLTLVADAGGVVQVVASGAISGKRGAETRPRNVALLPCIFTGV